MRRAAAVLILSCLSGLVLLPDSLRAQKPQGEATAASSPAVSTLAMDGDPAAPASAGATVAPATAVMEVTYERDLLTVRAEGADLAALLKRIAEVTGSAVEVAKGVSGKVSVVFKGQATVDGVNRILEAAGARSYAATFVRDGEKLGVQKIVVAAQAKGDTAPAVVAGGKVPRTEAEVREYLKEKYGTDWRVEFREGSQRIRVLRGRLPISGELATAVDLRPIAEKTLREIGWLLKTESMTLVFKDVLSLPQELLIEYGHTIDGVPVEDSKLFASYFTGTGEFQIVDQTHPDIMISTIPRVSAEEAVRVAEEYYRELITKHSDLGEEYKKLTREPQLVISPRPYPAFKSRAAGFVYRLVWRVDFPLRRHILISAEDGRMESTGAGRTPYVLSANRYGVQDGPSYLEGRDGTDQIRQSVGPLPGLYVWKAGDGEIPSITTGVSGEFELTDGFPLFVQLRGPGLRVYHDATPSSPSYDSAEYAHWFFGPSFPPFYDESTVDPGSVSGQHNVFHQLRRGLKGFGERGAVVNGVGAVEGDPGEIQIQTGYEASDMRDAWGDAGDGKIRLRGAASLWSDVILHELAHLAVETNHGAGIGGNALEEGVSEGLADYLACSINEDQFFEEGLDESYDLDAQRKPTDFKIYAGQPPGDLNQDKVYDAADWEHYGNGPVIAAILWDLKKDGLLDQTLTAAIKRLEGHAPDDLYTSLSDSGAGTESLWAAFSAHGVNLSASAQGLTVHVEWFKHHGTAVSSYAVQRSNDESLLAFETLAPAPGATSYADVPPDDPGTYYYRVIPLDAQGAAADVPSNVAKVQFTGLMAPENLHLVNVTGPDTAGERLLTLAWEATQGGIAPSGYELLRMEQDATWWEQVEPVSGEIKAGDTVARVKHPGESACKYRLRPYVLVQVDGQPPIQFGPASQILEYPQYLDLAVVVQPWYPYYNFTAGYLRRYQKTLMDLLDALAVSEVKAGKIRIVSSGRDDAGEYPSYRADYDYGLARSWVSRSGNDGGWLDPLAPKLWRANRLDIGLRDAREFLGQSQNDPSHIRKALIFTNWFHYDPSDPVHVPPSTSGKNWVAPFQAETNDFDGPPGMELDAIDFFPGEVPNYVTAVRNANRSEWRFPFDLENSFSTTGAIGSKKGHLVVRNPYPAGVTADWSKGAEELTLEQKRLLFPWINEIKRKQYRLRPGEQAVCELPADATMGRLSIGVRGLPGTAVSLVRPDGSVVSVEGAGDTWITDDPLVSFRAGMESVSFVVESPTAGLWRVQIDGAAVTNATDVVVHAYTSSRYRVDPEVPASARPGESFSFTVAAGGAAELLSPSAVQYPGSAQAPQALYYQGVCYELLKDKPAARAAFKTMVDRYPQHAWSNKAREKAHE